MYLLDNHMQKWVRERGGMDDQKTKQPKYVPQIGHSSNQIHLVYLSWKPWRSPQKLKVHFSTGKV
jgi:hypothetical protein